MGKYRSRLQIVADILSVVSNNDAKKTRIMYLANLSWGLLTRYMNDLIEAGLVGFGSSNRYVLTPKGKRFLDKFSGYSKLCKGVEKQLKDVESERMILENMCFNRKQEAESDL